MYITKTFENLVDANMYTSNATATFYAFATEWRNSIPQMYLTKYDEFIASTLADIVAGNLSETDVNELIEWIPMVDMFP